MAARHAEELASLRSEMLKLHHMPDRGFGGKDDDGDRRGPPQLTTGILPERPPNVDATCIPVSSVPEGSLQPSPSAPHPNEPRPCPPVQASDGEEACRADADVERAVSILRRTVFEGDRILAAPPLQEGAACVAPLATAGLAPAVVLKIDGVKGEVILRFDEGEDVSAESGVPVPVSLVMKNGIRCAFAGITRRLLLGSWESEVNGESHSHEVSTDGKGRYIFRTSDQSDGVQCVDRQRWGLFLGGKWQLDEAKTLPEQLEWFHGQERRIWRRI